VESQQFVELPLLAGFEKPEETAVGFQRAVDHMRVVMRAAAQRPDLG